MDVTHNILGNVVPGIKSIINSHVIDEAAMFTPSTVDEAVINAVLDQYFGTSPATKSAILAKYSTIPNAKARIKSLYQFSTFTCSNRFISEGFPGKTYNLQYSRGTGIHGSDIAADFYIPKTGFDFATLTDRTFGTFATTFQSYLLSHARTGSPNTLREKGSIEWPHATMGPTITGVMNATDRGFELIADETTREEDCGFWKDVLAGMTSSMGTFHSFHCGAESCVNVVFRLCCTGRCCAIESCEGCCEPISKLLIDTTSIFSILDQCTRVDNGYGRFLGHFAHTTTLVMF
jgi:hypothetical protein